ncbi:hypothetical protein V5O39_05830 [Pseudomonas parakoreensis]
MGVEDLQVLPAEEGLILADRRQFVFFQMVGGTVQVGFRVRRVTRDLSSGVCRSARPTWVRVCQTGTPP